MNNSFSIILLYYDNPILLNNWFIKLFIHSDFFKYSKFANIIIADSGTPLNKLEESLNCYNTFKNNEFNNITYLRAETEELRKLVPPEIDARPACHTYNMALDYSQADIIYTSVVGHIYSPKYFSRTLAIHLQDDRAVVLPQRFDLDYLDYHEKGFNDNWEDIITKHKLISSGGWPDGSFRRKWALKIGGFDENYITIAPVDMDFYSRLGNFLDDGTPSNRIFPNMPQYNSLKLNFYQPFDINEIISLTCNQYKGHTETNSPRRQLGYEKGLEYYLKMWSQIKRNEQRIPIKFKEY
jgi:hypothetical protein